MKKELVDNHINEIASIDYPHTSFYKSMRYKHEQLS